MVRFLQVALLCLLGCVGPLDREDGALVLALTGVPAEVDTLAVTVSAGGRTFSERLARPADDVVDSFSAIPAGVARIDVRLLAGEQEVSSRIGIEVEVEVDVAVTLPIDFAAGPSFRIREPKDGEEHALRGGAFIPVEIVVDGTYVVTAEASGEPVVLRDDGASLIGTIDPALAGEILPADLVLSVTACLGDVCEEKRSTVSVTRNAWASDAVAMTRGRPGWLESAASIAYADAAGDVHFLSIEDGTPMNVVSVGAPVFEDVAVFQDEVYVVDDDGKISVAGGASFDVGATTAPTAAARAVYVGAGDRIYAVTSTGARMVEQISRRMRAPIFADEEGLIAADILGNVLVTDANEVATLRASVGAPVYAQPTRFAGLVVVATGTELHRFDGGGASMPPIDVGQPIAHAPVSLQDQLVLASGDTVLFLDGSFSVTDQVRLGQPITGAPADWGDGRVAVGLRNGLVMLVSPTEAKPMGQVAGAAMAPLVVDLGGHPGCAVVGTAGDFALLEPEVGF